MISTEKFKTWGFWVSTLFILTALALLFQVGHFLEHFIQVTAWIFGEQQTPYMTPPGRWLMDMLGEWLVPLESIARQKQMGFELLHLIGNTIFFLGVVGLYFFVRTKKVIWALAIEGFHLYEHLSLTVSAYFIGKSIGFSTLFGYPMSEWAYVTYRVWWHFMFNLIPSALVIMALYAVYKIMQQKNTKASSQL